MSSTQTGIKLKEILLFMFAFTFDDVYSSSSLSPIGDLRNSLLEGYHKSVRPVLDHNHNTTVNLGMSISSLELPWFQDRFRPGGPHQDKTGVETKIKIQKKIENEHDQLLTVRCFLLVSWKDEFLNWDPSLYNITSLHFAAEEIWTPDIALYNSAKNGDATPKAELPLVAQNNGVVYWAPHYTAEVPCLMDISHWPSDMHTCSLKMGSWAHHGDQINLEVSRGGGINLLYYRENDRWRIMSYNSTKKFSVYQKEVFHYIDFDLTLRRLATSHAIYISQTTLTVIVIVLSSYFLPLQFHLSRFLLHLFALGALAICNITMFVTLPATGGHIPFVVKYFSGAMVLTTLSLLCQVIMANTMTYISDSSFGLKGVCRALIGFPQHSHTIRNLINEEVTYSNLEEEITREVSETAAVDGATTNSIQCSVQNSSSQISGSSSHVHDIHRVINIVLFAMFAVSYVVDYGILRSSIGY